MRRFPRRLRDIPDAARGFCGEPDSLHRYHRAAVCGGQVVHGKPGVRATMLNAVGDVLETESGRCWKLIMPPDAQGDGKTTSPVG